ncbi:hypothetical protein ASF70_12705 [Rhizobium sp. Leaf321]|uniref:hypothetical protein n=1 Tax=Rhizobium sp. Leaf321 TaxID=1736335 RepID=UPI0007162EA7|nr:hypothetical protein [Rhizobium sp. Leaf321]KQQ72388.1 hypothetical protein ASF70_12705 [Rhizobium sp. Leaf321]
MTVRVKPSDQKSRTYSKRLTAWSLGGIYALAFWGTTADVLTVVGSSAIALIALYIGVGHLDLRSWVASGLLDLRKKGGTP